MVSHKSCKKKRTWMRIWVHKYKKKHNRSHNRGMTWTIKWPNCESLNWHLLEGGIKVKTWGAWREVCGPICGLDQLGQRVQKVECLMNSLHSSVIRMGEKVEEIELDVKTTITCRVCYKHAPIEGVSHVNVFGCGHCFCSVHMCAFSMTNCATCRAPIVGKFKLFLWVIQ